jgi:PKD repeat protein
MNRKIIAVLILSIALVVFVLHLTGTLKLFYTVSTAGTLYVLEYNTGSPIAGAIVVIDASSDTFHNLGDVIDTRIPGKGMDGKIDNYDLNAELDLAGRGIDYTNPDWEKYYKWFDINKDNKIDMKDVIIVESDVGLVWHQPPILSKYVTDNNGAVSLNVVQTNLDNTYQYLANVSLSGVIREKTNVLIDVRNPSPIYVVKLKPPIAQFTYSPQNPTVGQTITFDASASYDPDGTISKYEWDFNNDGVTDKTGVTVTWSYSNYGSYTVKLTVTDNDGLSSSTTQTIKISSNPVAQITVDKTSGLTPLTVRFDGSGSYDPDGGSITAYSWDFGDGSTGTGSVVSHTYSLAPGVNSQTFTATLTVTDDEGAIGSTSVNIYVYRNAGFASFAYSPTYPYPGETITFDASESRASTGAVITEYHWTFDSETKIVTTATTTYSFASIGQHTVSLYIVDSSGYTSPIVTEYPEVIEEPVADFSISGETIAGKTLTFTFTGKGRISTYSWSFGDGAVANTNPATHSYSSANTYTVTLTITDIRGTTKSIQKPVTITVEPPTLTILTLLEFPPSTQVNIKVLVTDKSGNKISGATVTLSIAPIPEINYAGTTKSSDTGPDGVATISILSPPSSLYKYNATISCLGTTNSYILKVLPQILVKTTQFNYEQTYKPGDYDFIYSGQTVDKETGVIISDDPNTPEYEGCALVFKELKDETGKVIPSNYIYYESSGGAFTFKAKVYDYYASINPNFNYEPKTLTLTLIFARTGYVQGILNVTAKMGPPSIVAVIGSTSVTVGTNSFKIAFKDKQGQPYAGLTASNIEVVITTPSGTTLSTSRELANKYYFDDSTKTITVAYDFTELGTYKITVNFFGLPFTQPSYTFNVNCTQASVVPPILTNPYVIGFIGLIILILLLRRRK